MFATKIDSLGPLTRSADEYRSVTLFDCYCLHNFAKNYPFTILWFLFDMSAEVNFKFTQKERSVNNKMEGDGEPNLSYYIF